MSHLPATNLTDAFNACDPASPLDAGDPRYVDLPPGRGDEGSAATSPLPEDELTALVRLLRRSQGFSLAFVRSNAPVDTRRIVDDLIAAVSADELCVRELRLVEPLVDLYGKLNELRPALAATEVTVVTGFEHSIPSGVDVPPALERLNMAREYFRRLPGPVVLLLPEYALVKLARKAPDFWAWRSGIFEARSAQVPPLAPSSEMPGDGGLLNLSLEGKLRHLEMLMEMLAEHERRGAGSEADKSDLSRRIAVLLQQLGEPDEAYVYAQKARDLSLAESRERALALNELAAILEAQGELDEALRIRQEEELPVFEKLGDVREQAVTRGHVADIFAARGELDEALRIRWEVLTVYEQLNDVRERAVTMGQIADVHQVRGELDEAIRIRHEKVLPVYEELKDFRGRAVTMGRIADVLEARGELDEVLRIRQEEELLVYEKLGDVRGQAMALAKIADVLKARGDYDEALRIYREESLPIFERLGRRHDLVHCRGKIAELHLERDHAGDRRQASELLHAALRDAECLRIPEADWIRRILRDHRLNK